MKNIRPLYIKIFVVIAIILIGLTVFRTSQFTPVNPYKDNLNEDKQAGKTYSLIYNGGEINSLTKNAEVFSNLKKDLLIFSRTFYYEKIDNSKLSAFTFKKGYKKISDDTFEFTGKYYGVSNLVTITATKIKNNNLKVSITDDKKSNVDSQLNLNGPMVNLINNIPIETTFYTIRYLQEDGTIVVTFYKGYNTTEIDSALAKITNLLGVSPDKYSNRIKYYVNGLGQYPIDEIKDNQSLLNQ